MSNELLPFPISAQRFSGYTSDPNFADTSYLAPPSQNCIVTDDGKVESRKGYLEEFSIGVENKAATSIYHKTYDIAFFALGTKVYYRDFANNVSYDTGITLTDGTTTRFAEFFGDIYLTNTTDGIYRIMCTRLNGAVSVGGDVTVDVDGAARLSVFGDTTGNIRINGVNEAFSSVTVSTGVLDTTSSAAYADNTVAIFVDGPYSSLEKPSKLLFWKSRLHIMGFPSATNADQPNNTVMAGQFVIGQTGATGMELILDFTYGTGGSTKILVGGGGRVTNILGVKDFIYFFTEEKAQATASSSIITSGSGIGGTIPDEKDELHGCLNEDCATVMGDSAITYITPDHRIMRLPIATDTGAAVSPPEEDFDVDIRDHLKNMDKDQTGALTYHYRGGRQTIYQVKILGQWYWFIWDHNIIRSMGSAHVRGAWQAPQQITPVRSFFERNGVLYGTDPSTDKVYSFFTTFTDNLAPIYCIIATGSFNVGNAITKRAWLQGDINQPSLINIRCYVTNNEGGRRSGSIKQIRGSDYTYSSDHSVGAVPVGDGGVEGETTQIANWDKEFEVFPSEGSRVQLVAENEQDGGYMSVSAFSLNGDQFPSSFSKSL